MNPRHGAPKPKRGGGDGSWQIRMKRGFTLMEMMVTVVIVAILAGAALLCFPYTTGTSRYTRTIGLIKMLHDGCYQYKTYDIVGHRFPEHAGGNSSVLHLRLGIRVPFRKGPRSSGCADEVRPPIVAFTPGMLEGTPSNTNPNPPRNIVDRWKRPIVYEAYPGARYAQARRIPAAQANDVFSIWSRGSDGNDEFGAGDDVSNWQR